MSTIERIIAREVLDSRGNPTVEAEVHTTDGHCGRAIVPSGISTGAAEAFELRDTADSRFDGRGVLQAVANVRNTLGPALVGFDAGDQQGIDRRLIELDGSPQRRRLGANALLSVSMAAAHAAAAARGVPLYQHLHELFRGIDPEAPRLRMPRPMINMISGGLHAGGNLDFQDFLIMPIGADSVLAGLEWTVRIYRRLGQLLHHEGFESHLVGDEGGYGPRLASNRQAVDFIVRAIERAGLRPGRDVTIAIDVASTHFYDGLHYRLKASGDARLDSSQLVEQLAALVAEFPITSLEDALAEDDWAGWQLITERLGRKVCLVGDDLFTTNVSRLRHGVQLGAANSVLIKVNQIGTLTETFETIHLARQSGYNYVVSARSGETEDTTIADLAVATAADLIKIGSIVRGERLAKYNRLIRIAEELEPRH